VLVVPPEPIFPPKPVAPPVPVVPPVAAVPLLPPLPPVNVPPPPVPELPAKPPPVPETPPLAVPPVDIGASAGFAASGEDALVLLLQPLLANGNAQPMIINNQEVRSGFIT
jgi:hypothetical protein